ncbi:MAG: TonB family protein [Acidobacteria bacterium]|nr:TonB family protein [Acidobacteriota bacterium]
MPVNVRRFCTSVLLAFTVFGAASMAQTQPQTTPPAESQAATAPPQTIPIKAPTSAEIMRDRISKAKAFIAVGNHSAAIYELENIRRETSDQSVQAVTHVLLMNSYLEQGDYKRAQDLLTQAFNIQKTNRPGSADIYNAVAAQVTKCSRAKLERYRSLGLSVSDRNLPLEAVNDVERMRETLELVISQAKEMGKDAGKTNTAMAMIEEASTSRSALARDEYDARRWTDEVADSREEIANSRSVITSAVDGTAMPNSVNAQNAALNAAANRPDPLPPTVSSSTLSSSADRPVQQPPANIAAANTGQGSLQAREAAMITTSKPEPADKTAAAAATPEKAETAVSKPSQETEKPIVVQNQPRGNSPAAKQADNTSEPAKTEGPAEGARTEGPIDVGPLIDYATKRSAAVYPPVARSMRTTGVVRVEITIDELGAVAEVQEASGPMLLQAAAKDAIRKWRFKPFLRNGQPVRAIGFVNFNFSL